MREIKFRAWDEEQGEMFDWEYMLENCYSINELLYDPKFIPLQYTGLEDRNSKEIYEGDRLSDMEDEPEIWEVSFAHGAFVGWLFAEEKWYMEWLHQIAEDTEIIGNIYENL